MVMETGMISRRMNRKQLRKISFCYTLYLINIVILSFLLLLTWRLYEMGHDREEANQIDDESKGLLPHLFT